IKSWLRYHNITLTRRIKIKNSTATPTIENEQVPSQDELARILRASLPRIKVAIALIAFAGLRPQSIGNHDGTDGLMLKDLPELRIDGGKLVFEKIPTMVVVRATLSKARHKYFTFLSNTNLGVDVTIAVLQSLRFNSLKQGFTSPKTLNFSFTWK
ncbi:MAG: hypothetical protein C0177_07260, partial [Fervidicoccus fontis]